MDWASVSRRWIGPPFDTDLVAPIRTVTAERVRLLTRRSASCVRGAARYCTRVTERSLLVRTRRCAPAWPPAAAPESPAW